MLDAGPTRGGTAALGAVVGVAACLIGRRDLRSHLTYCGDRSDFCNRLGREFLELRDAANV
jgi:hypothetical protein